MSDEKIINVRLLENLTESFPYIFKDNIDFKIKTYKSKKNIVLGIIFDKKVNPNKEDMVVKIFKTDNADNEFHSLLRLLEQNHSVPRLIDYNKPFLLMEMIQGKNLCDYINDKLVNVKHLEELESKARQKMILSVKMLAQWLARVHKTNIILDPKFSTFNVRNKGDPRLRDFIINFTTGELYGVDFEDSYEGNHIDDIAGICCSLLDTNPGLFEMEVPHHKIELIKEFLNEYYRINKDFKFNFKYFANRLIENLNTVIERREVGYGMISKQSILKKLVKD
ncbi:MAG: RIO1 family regulatory kinase/ATPase domain-containing protein [Promethearchaeota archaeon]